MADEISEAGRQERFAQWEKLGLDEVKQDLTAGGHRLIGGPPQVHALAREWVRAKEAEQLRTASEALGLSRNSALDALGLGDTALDRLVRAANQSPDPVDVPAPAVPAGEPNVENKSLLEWAGGTRATLAIAFTDIVGSTALGSELGDIAMREVRRRHFAQSTMLLAEHAGREIKTLGDSVMAVFRSVEAAFAYALALHRDPGHEALTARGIRAGIHIGSVDIDKTNIDGNEVAFAHRVIEAIAGAEIWLSDRAKQDIDLAGIDQQWQPHNVALKGFPGDRQLWSLATGKGGQGQHLTSNGGVANERTVADEQMTKLSYDYFAPELARIIRRQIYILDRATVNFTSASVSKLPPGDRWVSLKPAQPVVYPHTAEFTKLSTADAILLNEFYSSVQEIADIVSGWIDNDPPPPQVNAWNYLMQTVQHSLKLGKSAVERFCPDRKFNETMPAGGTLVERIERAEGSAKSILDAHVARHASATPIGQRVRRYSREQFLASLHLFERDRLRSMARTANPLPQFGYAFVYHNNEGANLMYRGQELGQIRWREGTIEMTPPLPGGREPNLTDDDFREWVVRAQYQANTGIRMLEPRIDGVDYVIDYKGFEISYPRVPQTTGQMPVSIGTNNVALFAKFDRADTLIMTHNFQDGVAEAMCRIDKIVG